MGDVTAVGLEVPEEYWYYDALNMSVTFTDINLMGRFTYATPGAMPSGAGAAGSTSRVRSGRGPFTPREPDYIAEPACSQ